MKDFEYSDSACNEQPADGCDTLKRPCRCGGARFLEPKMKRTNCCPPGCRGTGCRPRCCCTCRATCCDGHPCGCGA